VKYPKPMSMDYIKRSVLVKATGSQFSGISFLQALWLAGMWHATGLQATGENVAHFIKMASMF